MTDKTLRSEARTKVILSVLALVAIFVGELVGVIVVLLANIPDASLWSSIIPELCGAVVAVGAVVLLGGGTWASTSAKDIAYTFRFGWWCMAISVGLMVFDLGSYVSEGTAVCAGWLPRAAELALFCLLIGILEEFMFRGVVFQGLLAAMGGTHKGVVRAVMISSVIFGFAHVDVSTDFVDALSAVQALLKIVQTGLYAVLLCVISLRTRQLGGVSLFHGLDDFVILAPSIVLYDESVDIEYVVSGDDAVPTILYYLLVIALYLPFVVKALRELQRGQDVYRGAFMERAVAAAEARAAQAAAAQAVQELGEAVVPAVLDAPDAQPEPPAQAEPPATAHDVAATAATPATEVGAVPQDGSAIPAPALQPRATAPAAASARPGLPPRPRGL